MTFLEEAQLQLKVIKNLLQVEDHEKTLTSWIITIDNLRIDILHDYDVKNLSKRLVFWYTTSTDALIKKFETNNTKEGVAFINDWIVTQQKKLKDSSNLNLFK